MSGLWTSNHRNPQSPHRKIPDIGEEWSRLIQEVLSSKIPIHQSQMKPTEQFSHAAPIFPVKDVEKSIAFYRDQLGFELSFSWEDPPSYAVIRRGEGVSIHLVKREDNLQPSARHTSLYIFVYDVDKVFEEFQAKEVQITHPLQDQDYGMRDFDIIDPDGFRLCFGMSLERKGEQV